MSATGRGGTRSPSDYYATPAWVTRAIVGHLRGGLVALDPCCGEGAIMEVLQESFDAVRGIELMPKSAEVCVAKGLRVVCADALTTDWGRPQCVVTNPPYSLAMEFITDALRQVEPGGDVAMLLRLNFLGSMKRARFWKKNPCDVFVLPKRPSFVKVVKYKYVCTDIYGDCGLAYLSEAIVDTTCSDCRSPMRRRKVTTSTDASEYMWAVWGAGRGNRWYILDVEDR